MVSQKNEKKGQLLYFVIKLKFGIIFKILNCKWTQKYLGIPLFFITPYCSFIATSTFYQKFGSLAAIVYHI